MAVFSDQQIARFQKALQGPAPAYDPNWEITKQLLKLTTVQSQYILELQAQLESYLDAQQASSTTLLEALQHTAACGFTQAPLSEQEIHIAMQNLHKAITDYQHGKQVAQYAGLTLKFAAMLLL